MLDQVARDEAKEQWALSLAESDYLGWVAYVDGQPIFEAVPALHGAYDLDRDADGVLYRPEDRQTMQWKDLPHEKVERVELYWGRGRLTQPAFRIDRAPGCDELRFLQMKRGGITIPTQGGETPRRQGVVSYLIGYWDPARPIAELWEIPNRGQPINIGSVKDPWAPRPRGFGLSRAAFGL